MDEDDDDGDTALVGSLASRSGRGLGRRRCVLGFPRSRVPPFSRFGFPAQLFLGVSFGLLQGLRPRRRKELGSAIWTERGIQCWNVVMTGSAT